MKIEGTMKPSGSAPTGEARGKRPASTTIAGDANEKVELSSLSSSLNKAEAAMASAPEIDRARVDEIRQAISEGRFKIDANRVADGLIESVRQMLGAQK
ncbi:flagellar biosynthesis anti-sigma factor FlgM [Aromatoleum toluclasticum]|uniref:flagellar biosynthesis anti-sigma factor FlgM n=1 Tax=Aromatoleum toluclasticum TaxID=92003 RepID=UPI00037523F6|nr:flagellar biosynthesis anti-sigma factor FlgM [Aromatoleum toluclasticum]MCC4115933.1 flagellar biosynthesis anti-sigma factor FlgM [Aromatoleum toluclasticum]